MFELADVIFSCIFKRNFNVFPGLHVKSREDCQVVKTVSIVTELCTFRLSKELCVIGYLLNAVAIATSSSGVCFYGMIEKEDVEDNKDK